jgi:repressor LexA
METTLTVFEFVRTYLATHAWSPTLREIAEGCGFACPSSVVRHLDRLEGLGLLWRERGQARSIAITEKGHHFHL